MAELHTRAYAVLHVKSVDGDRRRIAGMASTPEPDRMGDIVEPLGIGYKNPVPLLLYHNTQKPVGKVWFETPTAEGLAFEAELPEITEPGTVRDRIEEAWTSLKEGLLGGVSIGFRALEHAFMKETDGIRFTKTEVLELSLVTIPANAGATVHTIKALDLAASGPHPSAVADTRVKAAPRSAPAMTQTQQVHDQISAFEATRQAKSARQVALMQAAAGDNITLDEKQAKEYDDLERDVTEVDAHLVRLRSLEKSIIAGATAITPDAGTRADTGTAARGGTSVVQVKSMLPKGTGFVRMTCAKVVCNGNLLEAAEYASRWKDTPEVALALKAAVAAGNITDTTWAGPLAVQQNLASEFVELLRPATIIGRIPGLRMVPFNTKVPTQTAGGTYGWVGEGKPKPLTKLAFSSENLVVSKAAGIIVITEELARLSSPSAEAVVRDDMIKGIAQFLDGQFIDPAVAAVTGVNPASITNGLTPIVSTDDPMTDLVAVLQAFAAANVSISGGVLIMNESNGLVMGLVRDAQGNTLFPGVTAQGGTAQGFTVITSNTASTNVIALQPSRVLVADEGQVSIDVSREASLQMDSAPTSPADATTVLVSLWQHNMVGLRAERLINWKRLDNVSVQILTGAVYAPLLVTPSAAAASARTAKTSKAHE
jgi:HK97 family phage major capsid protein/HK97 family phage prohead protease